MAIETKGVAELGRWCPLPNGDEVLVEPTKKVNRVRITIRPQAKESHVRHRRHRGRFLTQGPEIG